MSDYDFEGFDNLPIESIDGPVNLDRLGDLPEENFLVPDEEYDFGGSVDLAEKKVEKPEEEYGLSMLDVLSEEEPKQVLNVEMLDEGCNGEREIKLNTEESDGSDAEDAEDNVEDDTLKKLPKSTEFKRPRGLDRHVSVHGSIKNTNTKTSYHCSECNFQAKLKSHLIIHKKVAHYLKYESTVAPNQCSECFLQMKDRSSLILHMKTVHNLNNKNVDDLKIFNCPECPFSTKHRKLYEMHKSYYHEKVDYDYSECTIKTIILKNFKSNMESHKSSQILHTKTDIDLRNKTVNKLKIFKCSKCVFSTKNRKRYFIHKSYYHKKRNYSCSECVYKTNFLKDFEIHIESHQKCLKLYKCNICIYSTNCKKALKRHSLSHSKIKLFSCIFCPYSSNRRENLKTHCLKHTSDDKAYKCGKCKFESIWKGSYTRHMESHNTQKTPCPNYCGFKCVRKSYLRQHVYNKHIKIRAS